jgi:hypothetical protein
LNAFTKAILYWKKQPKMLFGIKYNEQIKNVDKYLKILNLKDIKVK